MSKDFFDPDLEPEASLLPKETPVVSADSDTAAGPEAPPARKKRQLWGYDLSTVLIAGAVVTTLLVYAVWPDTPPARTFIPDEPAVQSAPPEPEPEPVPEPIPEPVPEVTPQAPVDDAPPACTDTQAIRLSSDANREAITALDARVTALEQRLKDAEARQQAQASAPVVSASVKAKPVRPRVVRHAAPVASHVYAARSPQATGVSVRDWRIHAVYPGMAWIARNGSTWSVQPGDVLQGMTILSIDTLHRAVVTDRGVINRGS